MIKDALVSGMSLLFAFISALIDYIRQQTRINTSTDGWLDLTAFDFLGDNLKRAAGQSDASFKALIVANIFRRRCTRQAVIDVLTQLTGNVPMVFEPARPADTGALDGPGLAYDLAGGLGDLNLPFQSFVVAYRPAGAGIANVAGYDIPTGAYDTASQSELVDLSMITDFITDADIFNVINLVRPAAYTIWARIAPAPASA